MNDYEKREFISDAKWARVVTIVAMIVGMLFIWFGTTWMIGTILRTRFPIIEYTIPGLPICTIGSIPVLYCAMKLFRRWYRYLIRRQIAMFKELLDTTDDE